MIFHNAPSAWRINLFIAAGMLIAGLPGCDKSKAAPQKTDAAARNEANVNEGKLGGLYVRQRSIMLAINGRLTFNLVRDFFYFFPDGHILFGVPNDGVLKEHPSAANFAAFNDIDPKMRGTYAVKGSNIIFHPDEGKESAEPFSVPKAGDDSVLQIGAASIVGSVKAMPFKDGQKLDGTYQYDGTVGLRAAITVFNVNTLTFRPDGTLGSDQLSGVDTVGVDTKVGNSGVTTHSQTNSAGTYHFNEYTLSTTIGGKTEKRTAFRWAGEDKPSAPGLLCIAGRVYSRQQPKK
ncbi:MAG TPA: hypothetical protein VFC46_06880 [Humisphaera sp.]|nr:hypothetical protein [Humisphaera sp.]